jgi:hypothetical protein
MRCSSATHDSIRIRGSKSKEHCILRDVGHFSSHFFG